MIFVSKNGPNYSYIKYILLEMQKDHFGCKWLEWSIPFSPLTIFVYVYYPSKRYIQWFSTQFPILLRFSGGCKCKLMARGDYELKFLEKNNENDHEVVSNIRLYGLKFPYFRTLFWAKRPAIWPLMHKNAIKPQKRD